MNHYNENAGRNVVAGSASDRHGNAQGSQYDLGADGAFTGQRIAVLQLHRFDFEPVRKALGTKGFKIALWDRAPSPMMMRRALAGSCQFWLISDRERHLSPAHYEIIREFYEGGNGLYLWGDNEPYYADANMVSQKLFGTTMSGNVPGDQVVGLRAESRQLGLLKGHLLTTGLQHLYEGITIATIGRGPLTPLLYGSAGNLVSAFHDRDGRRAILDGGFTRLFCSWDESGTARYVKNAAAWLANLERRPAPVRQIEVKASLPELVPTVSAVLGASTDQSIGLKTNGHGSFAPMKGMRTDGI